MNMTRCDKCGKEMKIRTERIFGENVKVKVCGSCGNRLVSLDEAIKLQEKIVPRLHVEKKIIKIGNSSAITIPKDIQSFFLPGSKVSLDFDPKNMEIKIKKE